MSPHALQDLDDQPRPNEIQPHLFTSPSAAADKSTEEQVSSILNAYSHIIRSSNHALTNLHQVSSNSAKAYQSLNVKPSDILRQDNQKRRLLHKQLQQKFLSSRIESDHF